MYYPFLRGRQNELLALRELADKIAKSGKVTPIIEPVNLNSTTVKSFMAFRDVSMPFILIANPANGTSAPTMQKIRDDIYGDILDGYNCYKIGFLINERTTYRNIEDFVHLFPDVDLSLIHYYSFPNPMQLANFIAKHPQIKTQIFISGKVSRAYFNTVSSNTTNIIVNDGFHKAHKNALYPPDEFYSDLHATYSSNGFDGFGDFSIVGDDFTETGGPVYAIAIHFPYLRKNNEIWIRHFLSDSNLTISNQGGKFAEAINKLIAFFNGSRHANTEGAKDFIELHRIGHYPGLGSIKKISIKHHLELVISII